MHHAKDATLRGSGAKERPSGALPESGLPVSGGPSLTRAAMLMALPAFMAGCSGGGGATFTPPALSMAAAAQLEGSEPQAAKSIGFTVQLAVPAPRAFRLSYHTTTRSGDGEQVTGYARSGPTCASGVDFIATQGDIEVRAGQQTVTLPPITLCRDAEFEPNEQFTIMVQGGAAPVAATAMIMNDDAGGLNDTGITQCMDATTGAVVACSATAPSGQDGEHGRDVHPLTRSRDAQLAGFSFTKLAPDGARLTPDNSIWRCIHDEVTGLVWLVDQTPATSFDAMDAGRTESARRDRLCGRDDWRLPQADELVTLVHAGKETGAVAIDASHFPSHQPRAYWSASSRPDQTSAWRIDFASGAVGYADKTETAYAPPLVAGQTRYNEPSAAACTNAASSTPATDRFLDHRDGTVTDKRTGLMWMQCSDGQSGDRCSAGTPSGQSTWQAVLQRVREFNSRSALGYDDWRLPNRNELGSLVERQCGGASAAIDSRYFPMTQRQSYWTSSPVLNMGLTGYVWYVNFFEGDIGPAPATGGGEKYLRLVRAGQ